MCCHICFLLCRSARLTTLDDMYIVRPAPACAAEINGCKGMQADMKTHPRGSTYQQQNHLQLQGALLTRNIRLLCLLAGQPSVAHHPGMCMFKGKTWDQRQMHQEATHWII